MLGENKSLRKQVATRVVPPSKLLAHQNPLEFIPVAPPQPEATRQRKLDSGTQTSFPKAFYGKSLRGGGGKVCGGGEGESYNILTPHMGIPSPAPVTR